MKNKLLPTLLLALMPLATSVTMQANGKDSGDAGAVEFTCAAWENLPYPELNT